MGTKSSADIGNTAVRMLLQKAGRDYDRKRIDRANSGDPKYKAMTGFKPFSGSKAQLETLLAEFTSQCCYCSSQVSLAADATNKKMHQDHVVPINMASAGLHAWGNIVPACEKCNSEKHGRTLEDYLLVVKKLALADPQYTMITSRVTAHQAKYGYAPNADLKKIAIQLYHGLVGFAEMMVAASIDRAEKAISRL